MPRLPLFPGEAKFSCEEISPACLPHTPCLVSRRLCLNKCVYSTTWLSYNGAKGRAIGNLPFAAADRCASLFKKRVVGGNGEKWCYQQGILWQTGPVVSLGIWAHLAFGAAGLKVGMVQPKMVQLQRLLPHALCGVYGECVQERLSQPRFLGLIRWIRG